MTVLEDARSVRKMADILGNPLARPVMEERDIQIATDMLERYADLLERLTAPPSDDECEQVELAAQRLEHSTSLDMFALDRADLSTVIAATRSHFRRNEPWVLYEEAIGVAWQVDPPTEENARHEAELVGSIGYRVLPKSQASDLQNAWAHGKHWALKLRNNA